MSEQTIEQLTANAQNALAKLVAAQMGIDDPSRVAVAGLDGIIATVFDEGDEVTDEMRAEAVQTALAMHSAEKAEEAEYVAGLEQALADPVIPLLDVEFDVSGETGLFGATNLAGGYRLGVNPSAVRQLIQSVRAGFEDEDPSGFEDVLMAIFVHMASSDQPNGAEAESTADAAETSEEAESQGD